MKVAKGAKLRGLGAKKVASVGQPPVAAIKKAMKTGTKNKLVRSPKGKSKHLVGKAAMGFSGKVK